MAATNLIVSTLTTRVMQDPIQWMIISLIILPIFYIFSNEFVRKAARIPGLKGPSGLPLIGNLWQIRVNAAEKYREWSKVHGSVYQIQLGNVPVVVVNSAAAAKVLFGQNAQALSSRPEFYTFHKVNESPGFRLSRICVLNLDSCHYPRSNTDTYFRFCPTQLEQQSELRHIAIL